MIINHHAMDEINAVQYEIFKVFHNACAKMNLRYYLVHGSLLGAVRHKGFFPFDDDIDVAMPRKDYNILMRDGGKYINGRYFVQSHITDRDLPIVFAKIRDSETTFIQPILNNFDINKGIYIDVFPIDNYPIDKKAEKRLHRKGYFCHIRVETRLPQNKKTSLKKGLLRIIAKVIYPSWERARDKYNNLYSDVPETGRVIVRGGKRSEVNISSSLFGEGAKIMFEGISSYAPQKTDEYLELIYGDYMNYEPMGKDMVSDTEVRISASIVDTHKSYKEYLNI